MRFWLTLLLTAFAATTLAASRGVVSEEFSTLS